MMEMQLDKQILVSERQQRAWSQSQLAEACGLSLRTVQRIEKTGKASLESTKALASVFSLQVAALCGKEITECSTLETSKSAETSLKWVSKGATNLSIIVFMLSSFVMLLLVLTGIGPRWINDLRDTVFSAQLSASTLMTISSLIALIMTFTVACLVGVFFDALRNQGLYSLIVSELHSGRLSAKQTFRSTINKLSVMAKTIIKPTIAACAVLLISGCGIYLTMEEYQKQNLSKFIQKAYSSPEG